jgi:hypothetical protein
MSNQPSRFLSDEDQKASVTLPRKALMWLLFFLICLGLGYPTLNRYDPAKSHGTSDVADYRAVLVGADTGAHGAKNVFERIEASENYYRVLVPYVAKPFYRLARGHLRTWDPALLGLLIANSIFTATTATLLVIVGIRLRLDVSTSLLGAALFLLNFCVANFFLVGLVDSAECCFLMVIVWTLLSGFWFLLPLWGIFGALAKETFVPISALFVFGWWVSEARRDRLNLARLGWLAVFCIASATTVTIAMSAVAGGLIWPWQLAAYMRAREGFLGGLRNCLLGHGFWYVFVWLLPLGLVRLRRLPRPWVGGAALAFGGALALGAYHDASGNVARALFSVSGPLLSLSAAMFLSAPASAELVPSKSPAVQRSLHEP